MQPSSFYNLSSSKSLCSACLGRCSWLNVSLVKWHVLPGTTSTECMSSDRQIHPITPTCTHRHVCSSPRKSLETDSPCKIHTGSDTIVSMRLSVCSCYSCFSWIGCRLLTCTAFLSYQLLHFPFTWKLNCVQAVTHFATCPYNPCS